MKTVRVLTLLLVIAALLVAPLPAFAAAKAPPATTGGVGYTAYGVVRHASFNAHQSAAACGAAWNLNGTYTLDFVYQGGVYSHDAVIINQTGNSFDISGGNPPGGSYQYAWSGAGTLAGNALTIGVDYTAGAVGTHMDMTGVIAPDGTMSGTWSDNYGGTRTGTWSTTAGAATQVVTGCTGKGVFNYTDTAGNHYVAKIQYVLVSVSGKDAWFAGPVTGGNIGAGQWLFAKVHDGGTPGRKGDQIWGSFVTQAEAQLGVATMANPGDGPFAVTSGNLVVHK